MKKHPKIVQVDSRGQIVIPKDIRQELGIDESTAFWVYSVSDEGILLKKVDAPQLTKDDKVVQELEEKSDRIRLSKKSLGKTLKDYKKTKDGNLDII